ncbi:MAG: TIGR04063 family PEP-CTERM/XrtA system glycosyltransferase [Burkholderiales bacterium]
MSLSILHVLDHSLPLHSGYAFRTIAILREQAALGWRTYHLTTPRHGLALKASTPAEETVDGWRFFRTSPPSPRWRDVPLVAELAEMVATSRRIGELIDRLRPDIVHAHSPVLNALPALWAARRRRVPVVYELRALWEDAAVDHGTTREGSLRYRASRSVETFALRRCDAITTICEGLRDEIVGRGIASNRVTVIPNAVDVRRFSTSGAPDVALRDVLGLGDATVLGFVGSFYAYEGVDLLLEALARLMSTHPALKVLLVGGGSHEPLLRERAASLGLADRVVFTGRVPNADVQRYYDLIDVLVYPRRSMRLTELVTPLKPLEAMAQGRMLVASDVGGHRELIRDGDNGTLFPAGDVAALGAVLARVLGARGQWPAMRARARAFVEEERSWDRSVARYREVYRRVAPTRVTAITAQRRPAGS